MFTDDSMGRVSNSKVIVWANSKESGIKFLIYRAKLTFVKLRQYLLPEQS